MSDEQELIFDYPIDDNKAKELTLRHLRENVGSIPLPDEPIKKGKNWIVPIIARYPRVIQNAITKEPDRVRYMQLKNLGEVIIDADTGHIIKKSGIVDIEGNIKHQLKEVNIIVQKALVKVGAKRFAQLPFPDLRFTPIQDIISTLSTQNKINLNAFYASLYPGDIDKYKRYMRILESESIQLIRITEDGILPGNNLIEIEYQLNKKAESENRPLPIYEKVIEALAFFYLHGYEHIDAIEDVLGIYLNLAGHYYEESYEKGALAILSFSDFEDVIRDIPEYSKVKYVKLPRYLIQLERIGLLQSRKHGDETFWEGDQTILNKIQREEEIIAPIHKILIEA